MGITPAAALTGATDLADRGDALLERVMTEASIPHLFDVIGGNAGAIPALLGLGRGLARPALVDLAIRLGDELLDAAERREEVWTWHPDRVAGPGISGVLLTGLAHGASGLGLALLELHAATGNRGAPACTGGMSQDTGGARTMGPKRPPSGENRDTSPVSIT